MGKLTIKTKNIVETILAGVQEVYLPDSLMYALHCKQSLARFKNDNDQG